MKLTLDGYSPSGERTGFISFGMFTLLARFGESELTVTVIAPRTPSTSNDKGNKRLNRITGSIHHGLPL